jgi:hypothetical protein
MRRGVRVQDSGFSNAIPSLRASNASAAIQKNQNGLLSPRWRAGAAGRRLRLLAMTHPELTCHNDPSTPESRILNPEPCILLRRGGYL